MSSRRSLLHVNTRQNSCAGRSVCQGLTLIELIICVGMLAILMGLAVPSFSTLLSGWRRDSAVNDFMGDLQLARSTAIRTSRAVAMCVSSDATTCDASPSRNDWRQGWIVFSDLDGNNTRNNNEPFIVQRGPVIGLQRMDSSIAQGRLVFRSNGLLNSGSNTVSILANGASATSLVGVRITQAGRASLLKLGETSQ